jgi:hypothetical protein
MKTNVACLCLTLSTLIAPSLFGAEPTPSGQPPAPRDYTLVFSDDFSTDPNSNGQWTVSRRQGDLNQEGYWDATKQVWYLTRQAENLAVAAFANYELTARSWKVDFKYRVDKKNTGADGFIFMFYKTKRPTEHPTAAATWVSKPETPMGPITLFVVTVFSSTPINMLTAILSRKTTLRSSRTSSAILPKSIVPSR